MDAQGRKKLVRCLPGSSLASADARIGILEARMPDDLNATDHVITAKMPERVGRSDLIPGNAFSTSFPRCHHGV